VAHQARVGVPLVADEEVPLPHRLAEERAYPFPPVIVVVLRPPEVVRGGVTQLLVRRVVGVQAGEHPHAVGGRIGRVGANGIAANLVTAALQVDRPAPAAVLDRPVPVHRVHVDGREEGVAGELLEPGELPDDPPILLGRPAEGRLARLVPIGRGEADGRGEGVVRHEEAASPPGVARVDHAVVEDLVDQRRELRGRSGGKPPEMHVGPVVERLPEVGQPVDVPVVAFHQFLALVRIGVGEDGRRRDVVDVGQRHLALVDDARVPHQQQEARRRNPGAEEIAKVVADGHRGGPAAVELVVDLEGADLAHDQPLGAPRGEQRLDPVDEVLVAEGVGVHDRDELLGPFGRGEREIVLGAVLERLDVRPAQLRGCAGGESEDAPRLPSSAEIEPDPEGLVGVLRRVPGEQDRTDGGLRARRVGDVEDEDPVRSRQTGVREAPQVELLDARQRTRVEGQAPSGSARVGAQIAPPVPLHPVDGGPIRRWQREPQRDVPVLQPRGGQRLPAPDEQRPVALRQHGVGQGHVLPVRQARQGDREEGLAVLGLALPLERHPKLERLDQPRKDEGLGVGPRLVAEPAGVVPEDRSARPVEVPDRLRGDAPRDPRPHVGAVLLVVLRPVRFGVHRNIRPVQPGRSGRESRPAAVAHSQVVRVHPAVALHLRRRAQAVPRGEAEEEEVVPGAELPVPVEVADLDRHLLLMEGVERVRVVEEPLLQREPVDRDGDRIPPFRRETRVRDAVEVARAHGEPELPVLLERFAGVAADGPGPDGRSPPPAHGLLAVEEPAAIGPVPGVVLAPRRAPAAEAFLPRRRARLLRLRFEADLDLQPVGPAQRAARRVPVVRVELDGDRPDMTEPADLPQLGPDPRELRGEGLGVARRLLDLDGEPVGPAPDDHPRHAPGLGTGHQARRGRPDDQDRPRPGREADLEGAEREVRLAGLPQLLPSGKGRRRRPDGAPVPFARDRRRRGDLDPHPLGVRANDTHPLGGARRDRCRDQERRQEQREKDETAGGHGQEQPPFAGRARRSHRRARRILRRRSSGRETGLDGPRAHGSCISPRPRRHAKQSHRARRTGQE